MNNTTTYDMDWLEQSRKRAYDKSPEAQAQRDRATAAFRERTHDLWHQYRGADAPCRPCGNVTD